jgi:hypothetical protein
MAEQVRVQQALFGYREGHNLVAASVPLPPSVRHFLATITDASGSETPEGFNIIYTGLPVPQTDFYALFCTWPAPEMPRPGCVWSHVLLVELADLARMPDLSVLPGLCLRPKPKSPFSDYEHPLTLSAHESALYQPSAEVQLRSCSLLTALYVQPDNGIIFLAEQSALWEATVFAIWSQQWPRLRRNFAFSTGSLGDRRLAGVAFDLQVAPSGSLSLWRRSGLPTIVLEPSPNAPSPPAPSWTSTVQNDLTADSSSPLRRFLFTYGSDIEKPRHAFARLATAYERLFLDSSDDWREKLRAIGENFPIQSEGVRLKEWLVKSSKSPDQKQNLERAWATSSFLLDAPEASAYASISIDHSDWAQVLWDNKRDEVLSLFARLVRQREKPITTAFAAAVANILQPGDLRSIAARYPELIPILLSYRPALAHDTSTWDLPGHTQWQVYEVLDRLSLSQKEWSEVMAAMFIAATCVAVRPAVEKAGPHAMEGAFHWLDNKVSHECLPSQAWREALATKAADLLAQGKLLPPAQLALCAWFVPPDTAKEFLSASREDVQALAQHPLDIIPLPLRLHTAFLLVALGLRAAGIEGLKPLLRGFYDVHEALASVRFSAESWQLLSPELPRLRVWRDWDRCEKLRRAVHIWLSKHVKTGNPLLQVATTPAWRDLASRIFASEPDRDDSID